MDILVPRGSRGLCRASRGEPESAWRDLDLLKRDSFAKAGSGRGRMRSSLLTALKRYLAKTHVHGSALKRGGGRALPSIEEEEEIRHTLASEDEFDEELRHLFTVFQGK